jgi:hypothetical protein
MKGSSRLLLIAVLAAVSGWTLRAETLTYPDLVRRLTDLDHLAVRPLPGEKTSLASSYDRKSQYDPATDTYLDWGANSDGSSMVRMEGDKGVMLDVQGPGCIWRTWSAGAEKGHVKMYLDGAGVPAVDIPFHGYFYHECPPFTRPNLVYITKANGCNNYTPIPFQKSCKIVADPGWGIFYHFTYTIFPADTVVPTFKLPLSAEDKRRLMRPTRSGEISALIRRACVRVRRLTPLILRFSPARRPSSPT